MFDRFHHDAQAAVARASEEAARSGQSEIGPEHLLLGLMAEPGHAADALSAAGADPADLRESIPGEAAQPQPVQADAPAPAGLEADPAQHASESAQRASESAQRASESAIGADGLRAGSPGAAGAALSGVPDGVRMTRDARRALDLALRAAQRLKHQHVSTGHVLLGIIDQPDSPAVGALSVAGIHVGMLRTDILRRLEAGGDSGHR